MVVLSLAAVGLVAKAIRPYREASAQTQQLSQTQRQIEALDRQNAALRRRLSYLKTPQGITTEAREMGYRKPGEIPIVVEGAVASPAFGSDVVPSEPDVNAHADSRLRRLWHRLTGH